MAQHVRPPGLMLRARHRFEAATFQLLFWVLPLLPRRVVWAMGDLVGNLCALFLRGDRRVAIANVCIALGDVPPSRSGCLASNACRTLGKAVLGLIWATRRKPEEIRDLLETDPAEKARAFAETAAGRGIVYVIPHYYDWEVASLACPLHGFPLVVVAEPGINPHLANMIAEARGCTGNKIVKAKNVMLTLIRSIKRGERVAMLIDVNARRGRGGVWVDFFGLPVYQSVATAELALRAGATIICCYCAPLPNRRIHLHQSLLLRADDAAGDTHDAKVRDLSQKVLTYYEDVIRAHPEPWLWTYKRWKRRPMRDRGRYPFYSKFDPNVAAERQPATTPQSVNAGDSTHA